uniref:Uncharacterized protein n=1 Tax=Arundo donax TaxID=35708 RepID=A0A0A9GCB3_ARUDO
MIRRMQRGLQKHPWMISNTKLPPGTTEDNSTPDLCPVQITERPSCQMAAFCAYCRYR